MFVVSGSPARILLLSVLRGHARCLLRRLTIRQRFRQRNRRRGRGLDVLRNESVSDRAVALTLAPRPRAASRHGKLHVALVSEMEQSEGDQTQAPRRDGSSHEGLGQGRRVPLSVLLRHQLDGGVISRHDVAHHLREQAHDRPAEHGGSGAADGVEESNHPGGGPLVNQLQQKGRVAPDTSPACCEPKHRNQRRHHRQRLPLPRQRQ
mmetsp:Transcript_33384/g.66815  ORF Transcript_33384/g.66815 Transcript_33384/m.66815 type:complete len:207 (+) Transcript_33384:62-682(+)